MHKPVEIHSQQDQLASFAARLLTSPGFASTMFLLACGLSLEWAVASGAISPGIVARPSEAIAGIFTLQRKVDFVGAIQITASLVAFAVVLELLFAIPFGYFLYRFRVFGLAYTGWLTALFAAPIFLLYPLFMVIFGRNAVTLIVMGFLPGVIPLILHVQQGFMNVSRVWINVGHSFGLSRSDVFWKIMIPAAAPTIFTGFRLALMYTLINIVALEYLVDIGGLGRVVADRYVRFDIAGTYSAIIAVTAISVLFNWIIGRAERLIRTN
jgi:NitT/TauT family transport system permease protein